MELKDLELNERFLKESSFVANGNKYTIVKRTDLSIDRFQNLHGYSEQIMRAMDNKPINEILQKSIAHCKKNDMFSLSVYLHEQLQSNNLYKVHPDRMLQACTTFIVREGEDLKLYDPTISEDKINDWKEEGLPFDAFFLPLLTHISKLSKIWSHFFQSLLEQEKKPKDL